MAPIRLSASFQLMLKQVILLGGRHWWLSFILWVVLIAPAQAATELRIAIKQGVSQVQVGSSTKAIIRDDSGQQVGELAPLNAFNARGGSNVALGQWRSQRLWIEPTANGVVWIGDRWYRGRTKLVSTAGGLTAVNYVNLEDYLYSVLGSEMFPNWPLEALKAQAVAARSYALYKRSTSANAIYDLGDTTTWQVYKGVNSEALPTHQAVDATAGQVMIYGGRVILAVFHSSSGGHTENVEDIWKEALPYLRGVADYDQGAPVFEWTKNFSGTQLSSLISGVGNVVEMRAERTTPQGRVVTMLVKGDRATRRISGNDLRNALNLKSTLFVVNPAGSGFQVTGRGFGHGLGLSQWGAHNLAAQGINYQQILDHYYQNAT
ncbi:MAG: SpoIID/LytB domain-containing protein, partial [Coleofasciculaceae cyanobacterium]